MLCDRTTPLHLAGGHDCAAVRDWVTFHTGAPLVAPEAAAFALGRWDDLTPLEAEEELKDWLYVQSLTRQARDPDMH